MADDEQQLFLIEFVVDRVNVPGVHAVHEGILPALTCVSFQILNLPVITIHQEAPAISNCTCTVEEAQVFRKGKSCLFALPTVVVEKSLHTFPIIMSVYKKLPPGVLPDVMLIGSATIEAKDLINSLVNQQVFKSGNPCKSMKDTFKISTATGQLVGDATVFIRASCFGSKIVTQFQIPHNKKPYLFKGAEESPVFQCRRIPSNLSAPSPKCVCPVQPQKKDGSGDKVRRSCCATPISPPPPPPPTPTKIYDTPQRQSRPCCPSLQGQKCPGAFPRGQVLLSAPSLSPGTTDKSPRNCGCPRGTSHLLRQ